MKKGNKICKSFAFKGIEIFVNRKKRSKYLKTNIYSLTGQRGIYFIYEDKKLIYIGSSGFDLYRVVMRHFQNWKDREFPDRINYRKKVDTKKYTLSVILMPAADRSKIYRCEALQINKFKPRDNKQSNYTKYNHKFGQTEKSYLKEISEARKRAKGQKYIVEDKYSFNKSGQLLDENGKVLF